MHDPRYPIPPHTGRGTKFLGLTAEEHYKKYPDKWAEYFRMSVEMGSPSIVTPSGCYDKRKAVSEADASETFWNFLCCFCIFGIGFLLGSVLSEILF